MKPLRICVDARLTPGTVGGVEQVIIGLAHGLSQLEDGDEEYFFLTNPNEREWLEPYVHPPCRTLPATTALRQSEESGAWLGRARPILRNAFHHLSPVLGRSTVPIPRSDGTLERNNIDVVHFTVQRAFLTSVPDIYQVYDLQHLHLPHFFTPRERLARETRERAFCREASLVTVSSAWGKEDLVRQYGVPGQKVAVVPFAPALDAYAGPSEAETAATRTKYSLPEEFLLYPAQTWAHKNHIGLLESLALLRDRQRLIVPLICTGKRNNFFPRIERRMRDLGLFDQVKFLGFVTPLEMRCLYQLCRALAFPTRFEGFGIPLLEAFWAGVPVACSKVTCLPELGADAALYFDPDSVEEIASAIHRVWADEELRGSLIERGRRRAAEFSWTRTARLFRAHYRQVAQRGLTDDDRALLAAAQLQTGPERVQQ